MPMLIRTTSLACGGADADAVAEPNRPGTTMMEYLMMISLIVVGCLAGIGLLSSTNTASLSSSTSSITNSVNNASGNTSKGK